jgi:hypothetical protein
MGKSLLEKIENKVYWGIVGALLSIAFGVIGLYTYFHEKKPNLLFEIVNESNVFDVHKSLENLTIYFDNENIQEKNLNLRIITVQISNNGEVDILQSYYDQKTEWGFKVNNGKIINNARIVNSNSDYLKSNISPKVIGGDRVNLEKVIFEKGKFISIELLVIHNRNNPPEIYPIGKIVGIESVPPVKTWEKNLEPSFWGSFFYGGFLINTLRPIIIFFVSLVLLVLILLLTERIGELKRKSKRNSREKEIYEIFGGKPEDKKINLIADSYIENGPEGLKQIETLFNNPDLLKVEIKRVNFEKEINEKIKEIKKSEGDDEVLMEDTDPYRFFYSAKYDIYWGRPHVKDLLENKIVEINPQGELMVDPEFRKTITKLVKRFKKTGLATRQVDN